jgi:hypothetical protein
MNEMQVTPVGLFARQPECLASPRRRSLPTHVALRLYFIGVAVGRHYFKGHPHKPEIDWRERKFVGIKNFSDAHAPPAAGRSLRRQRCGCQQCHRGKDSSHESLPVGPRAPNHPSEDLVTELACRADQNQGVSRLPLLSLAVHQIDAVIAIRLDHGQSDLSHRFNDKPARS